ncbi:MAG: molybdopterin-guanine dinucleotide biosynthesis protein B [Cohaesibacter sp.]|jgi:molybdopterin-guanine dinucleotide biosynthesis protein B|nr:molybdopterin-guanine dinucleotide biosynthesis protein B [Cohaesibacter sp.]
MNDRAFFNNHGHRVFGVTGWKNSGKTTLVVRLVEELVRRGYRISTIKHAHHQCDIDKPGADSFRHREAGAGEVALIAAGTRWALMHECRDEPEPLLGDILPKLSPCDLVLIEGYKHEAFPKIEVRRSGAKHHDPLAPKDDKIVALASDHPDKLEDTKGLPAFHLDDITQMADFIAEYAQLPGKG